MCAWHMAQTLIYECIYEQLSFLLLSLYILFFLQCSLANAKKKITASDNSGLSRKKKRRDRTQKRNSVYERLARDEEKEKKHNDEL